MTPAVESVPFVAQSAVARQLLRGANAVARSHDPVLIVGGTGAGKTLLARIVHAASRSARQPFVALHAGALPAEAFAALGDGGTVYFRGLSDASRHDKAALLHLLEPLAERRDVRVIASMT